MWRLAGLVRRRQGAGAVPAEAMDTLYDLETLRALSLFRPEVRVLRVTLAAEPGQLGKFGRGRGREAEVLLALVRAGRVLLVRNARYPPGVFRLPTGGIEPGELPQEAACREAYEETGFRVDRPRLLGVVDCTLCWPGPGCAPYVSYVFVAAIRADQEPRSANPGEVEAYRWLPVGALGELATRLRSLPPDWVYWGRFRAAAYDFIQCGIMEQNLLESDW